MENERKILDTIDEQREGIEEKPKNLTSRNGTLNCKNWDYTRYKKNKFLLSQWFYLSEEAAQGRGNNLIALSRLMGCEEKTQRSFSALIQKNFKYLFNNSEPNNAFFAKLEIIISNKKSYNCQG